MRTTRLRAVLVAAIAVLTVGGSAADAAGTGGRPADGTPPTRHSSSTAIADGFNRVDRTTAWKLTAKLKLSFPTFHTEGIAFTPDHIFLSAVEILEPTVKYPTPPGRYDRSPGKGVGHLFVMDTAGNLQKDITLGEGNMYHPGGIDVDGTNVWVPVAEYRPSSSTIVYRVDATTLQVTKQFTAPDHFGGIVLDKVSGHLVGNTWGSRRFAEWNLRGRQLKTWDNTDFFIDYQDCQYVPRAKMLCAGVTNLPQTPTAGGSSTAYELGGVALIDLRSHRVLRDIPFQQWSTAGHVATRNPFKMSAAGNRLTMRVAPDNGEEGNGTEILTYEAAITPTP